MNDLTVLDRESRFDQLAHKRDDALDALITASELVGRCAERAFLAEPDDSVPDRHWRQNLDTHRATRLRDFVRAAYEQADNAYHKALRESLLEVTLPGYVAPPSETAKT